MVAGNLNCPAAVTAAGVFYAFRCLMPPQSPASAGAFRPIELVLPTPSLLAAEAPAAVAAGNVETSMRVVDVVLRALAQALPERLPAASQGTMNNLALGAGGDDPWDYYETLAGGHGASARGPGASAQHSHMTNTLNTPIESVELHYPLRVLAYGLRSGSGGAGRHAGGEGVLRRYAFLAPATLTLLSERRSLAPWGLAGGEAGQPGRNVLNGVELPGKVTAAVDVGDVLTVETPGGGGYGEAAPAPRA
jgi:N-methylhydantoinase B